MSADRTAEAINRDAADWAVRAERVAADPGLATALENWLSADPRHRGALLRAQAIWARVGDPVAGNHRHGAGSMRRGILAGGLATALAAAFAGLWLMAPADQHYATRIGERARVALSDGSSMLLNTNTSSEVTIRDDLRAVKLDSGEARFEVAKDKTRPFVVSAGPIRVEAVGTAFVVRRRQDRADVAITDGVVRIWSTRAPTRFLLLRAGNRVSVTDALGAENAKVTADGMDRATAWSRGMIALDGMTLAEAAAEFNRYNRQEITVEQSLADRRLVGWFRASDPDGFATSAAAMIDGRVERDGSTTRIVRR